MPYINPPHQRRLAQRLAAKHIVFAAEDAHRSGESALLERRDQRRGGGTHHVGLMLLFGKKSEMSNFTSGLKTTWLGWDDAAVMGFAVLMIFWDVVRQLFQTN